jgi:hypothetical protein
MKKNETRNILRMSLNEEEKVINNKDIGIDKFSKADMIFGGNKSRDSEVKINPKSIPGKRKTIYLSQNALNIIKKIGSRLRIMDVESNDSKVIATALFYLNELDNESLIEKAKEVEAY